ncbi:MAG TPA: adenylate/guanylate cyclase domain-containing protein, partial [bacterium]|nr:adenylate/guanylate cyclase domain-containing protein [bacterium]
MRNLLPDLKLLEYSEDKKSGEINAAVLFVDISGFTSMTRKLMEQGKEGAEILSEMMNRLFSPLIDSVYDHGGFITNFAGDAFTAVFKNDNGLSAAAVALEMIEFFKLNPVFEYSRFSFSLSAKTGISKGVLKWISVPNNGPEHFFFYGKAIDEAAEAEHVCKANDISVTSEVFDIIKSYGDFEVKECGVFLLSLNLKPDDTPLVSEYDYEILSRFIPRSVLDHNITGEFREVVSVFMSYEIAEEADNIENTLSFFASEIQRYGGYISGFDFGDKGATVLALFGAPVSYEDNLERALNCLMKMRKNTPVRFRSGVTEGTVYAGFTGTERRAAYTALGDNVNLSARLMMVAPMDSDWILGKAAEKAGKEYELAEKGKHRFKGIDEEIDVFSVLNRHEKEGKVSFKTAMTGRQKELNEAVSIIQRSFDDSKLRVHAIYGEAGIGKSRLVYEITKKISQQCQKCQILHFSTDTILRQSMNIFNGFFQKFFKQSDTLSENENRDNFERVWDSISVEISSGKEEFETTKPYISALAGLVIKGSVYEILDAKSRYENTLFAIGDFFEILSGIFPMVLIFDDLHAIDKDSLEGFRTMMKKLNSSAVAVLILSRLKDDGTKPDFSLAEADCELSELIMDRLSATDIPVFVENVLEGRSSPELNEFVYKRSAGNPFFVEQLLFYMKENDYI